MTLPIALTCGEPAGVGPELAVAARAALGDSLPLFWIGDPRHLPSGTAWREVAEGEVPGDGPMAVLRQDFAGPSVPGRPDPANAAGVVAVTRPLSW